MNSIGDKLRHQRLQRGITLDTVASDTKIGARMLEAIEAEEFDRLPGGVFRKSFVLQYARYLGIDEEPILSDLKQRSGFDTAPSLPGEAEVNGTHESFGAEPEWRLPSLGKKSGAGSYVGSLLGFVAVILGCAAVYTWWQKETRVAGEEMARHAPTLKPEAASPPSAAPQTKRQDPAHGAPSPASPGSTSASTPGATAAAPSASPSQPPSSAPAPGLPVSGQPVRVNLTAGEETWVQISSDGKRVFSNSLHANETKVVEAAEKVRVLVGNAGGLEVSLNGKPIGPIGPRGQVRVIELTPSGYLIVSPKPPKPESLPL
ncbi:MAG: helix-turn-helix domain-containing protein [Bryobacteraceae bacterium]